MARQAVMTVYNVQLGLAVHIKAPNGKYIIIDLGTGAQGSGNENPLLKRLYDDIGYMIITHPHLDHIDDILNFDRNAPTTLNRATSITNEEVMSGVRECDKPKFEKYCEVNDRYSSPVSATTDPDNPDNYGGLQIHVFKTSSCDKANFNNFSSIIVLELANCKIVVCGDNEKDSLDLLMKRESFKDAVKNALEQLGVDVMIVGRGGGSIEDLWAFNERAVAEAVFNCSIPIISAVGHETDTTIIDYVADLRAPTPSAAAELAVWDLGSLLEGLSSTEAALTANMIRCISRKRDAIKSLERQLLRMSPTSKIRGYRQYHAQLGEQLEASFERVLSKKRHSLELYVERLKGRSPLERLKGGYSYVEDENGRNVRSVQKVQEGDLLRIHFQDGQALARVEGLLEE